MNGNENSNEWGIIDFEGWGEIDLKELFKSLDKEDKNHNSSFDLYYKVKISKKEAILGKEIMLKIKKRKIKVRIPPNIKDGQMIKLRREGETNEEQYGHLYIKIHVKK